MTGKSKEKGDFLEILVHDLHQIAGFRVERDVRIPTIDGSGRKRQIDVLLSFAADELGDCLVRFPIECRNYGRKIGTEDVDGFVGKLNDIGIETRFGIFVAVLGYTSDAMHRADAGGIRLLNAEGLTEDRLALKIREVLHGLVFWVAKWTTINSFHHLPFLPNPEPGYCDFYVEAQRSMQDWKSEALDEIWKLWVSGQIPCKFGEYSVCITYDDGGPVVADLLVSAHGVKLEGRLTAAALTAAGSGKVERQHIHAEADLPEGTISLSAYADEQEMEKALAGSTIKLGLRTPRIIGPRGMFWPLTEETSRRLTDHMRKGEWPDFDELEARNLLRAWIG